MRQLVGLVGVLALVAALTAPSLGNGFVHDDTAILVRGDYLHEPARIPELFAHPTMYVSPRQRGAERAVDTYRPVTLVTFVVDSQLWGRAAWGYHLTNLLLHLACVALVFFLAREVLGPRSAHAPVAALVFGLAPEAAEAHAWINGRSDVIAAIFASAALLAWRRSIRRGGASGHVLAGALFVLGLLSKEVVLLALPAIVAWPEPSPVALRARLARAAPFAIASAIYLAMRALALDGMRASESSGHFLRALLQLGTLLIDGAIESLLPTRTYVRMLSDDYARLPIWAHVLAWVLVVAIAIVAIAGRRRWPVGAWAAAWAAGTLAPVAMISTMLWIGFGRYLYVPMIAIAIAIADATARSTVAWPTRTRALGALGLAYTLLLAVQLVRTELQYESTRTLYGAIIAARPDQAHGYGWMAADLADGGAYAEAVPYYAQAVEHAPEEPRYVGGLADALFRTGRPADALAVAERGLARIPANAWDTREPLHVIAANVLSVADPPRAARHLLECARDDPRAAMCGEAIVASVTRHPLRAQYREIMRRELSEDPSMRDLAVRMSPLGL